MDRSNHYEAAFEAYLQWHRLCYVAVDETRRAMLGETRVKNLDFVVYGENGARLVVDVKGRRFPTGSRQRPRRVWECWSTAEDVDGLVLQRYGALKVCREYRIKPSAARGGSSDDRGAVASVGAGPGRLPGRVPVLL